MGCREPCKYKNIEYYYNDNNEAKVPKLEEEVLAQRTELELCTVDTRKYDT